MKKFKVGDSVGVGCLVDLCRECNNCKEGEEQYCLGGMTLTIYAPEMQTGESHKLTY